MDSPNIFKHAKSELSQDAFIKWLLEHLNELYPEQNAKAVARNFMEIIIKRFLDMNPEHEGELSNWRSYSVEIDEKSQSDNIDIFAYFKYENENKFALLIEDKTKANESRNEQVETYLRQKKDETPNLVIIPVYFKSSYLSASKINEFYRRGIVPFSYQDIHNIFSDLEISSTSNIVLHSWWVNFLERFYNPIESINKWVQLNFKDDLTFVQLRESILNQNNEYIKEIMFEQICSYLFKDIPLIKMFNIESKPGRTLYEYLLYKEEWKQHITCKLSFYFAWNGNGSFSFDMKTIPINPSNEIKKHKDKKEEYSNYREKIRSGLGRSNMTSKYGKVIENDQTKTNLKLQIVSFELPVKPLNEIKLELEDLILDVSNALGIHSSPLLTSDQ